MRPSSPGYPPFAVDPRAAPSFARQPAGPPPWLSTACGAALAALTILLALALMTWRATDPSFSTISTGDPRNALGIPGALVADVLVQTLGLATAFVLLPLAFWAAAMLSGRGLGVIRLRLVTAVGGILLLAGGLGALPRMSGWPIGAGHGGLIGDLLLSHVAVRIGSIVTFGAAPFAGLILAMSGVALIAISLGLSRAEWSSLVRTPLTLHLPDSSWVSHLKRGAPDEEVPQATTVLTTPTVQTSVVKAVLPPSTVSVAPAPVAPAPDHAPIPARPATPAARPIPSYLLPAASFAASAHPADAGVRRARAERIAGLLATFAIDAEVQTLGVGPCLDTFLVTLAASVKPARLAGLTDDLARGLGVPRVRVVTIPGRASVLLEVPRDAVVAPALRDLVDDDIMRVIDTPLILGRSTLDRPLGVSMHDARHILVAGGSVSDRLGLLRALTISLLSRASAARTRIIVVGRGLEDLMMLPQAAVAEPLMTLVLVPDLLAIDPTSPAWSKLIATMAEASGVHVLAATSNIPDAETCARFPTRIAFALPVKAESRTFLGTTGAEDLLPGADALIVSTSQAVRNVVGGSPARIHPVTLEAESTRRIAVWACASMAEPAPRATAAAVTDSNWTIHTGAQTAVATAMVDEIYERAIAALITARSAEPDVLCGRLGLAYPQALDLIARMMADGIITEVDGERQLRIARAA